MKHFISLFYLLNVINNWCFYRWPRVGNTVGSKLNVSPMCTECWPVRIYTIAPSVTFLPLGDVSLKPGPKYLTTCPLTKRPSVSNHKRSFISKPHARPLSKYAQAPYTLMTIGGSSDDRVLSISASRCIIFSFIPTDRISSSLPDVCKGEITGAANVVSESDVLSS